MKDQSSISATVS